MEDNLDVRRERIVLLYLCAISVACAVLAIMYKELNDILYLKMAFRVFIVGMTPFCIFMPFVLKNSYGEDSSDKAKAGKSYTKWEEFMLCVGMTILSFLLIIIMSVVGYTLYNLLYWVFT